MDGFGDSFVPSPTEGNPEVDPAAEFLAREQDQLAGLDDDIIAPAAAPQAQEPTAAQPAGEGQLISFVDITVTVLMCECARMMVLLALDTKNSMVYNAEEFMFYRLKLSGYKRTVQHK